MFTLIFAQASPPKPPNVIISLAPLIIVIIVIYLISRIINYYKLVMNQKIIRTRLNQLYWYLSKDNEPIGPTLLSELEVNFRATPNTLVCAGDGSGQWISISEEINKIKKSPRNPNNESSQKLALVASLLCFFLGYMGFHAFYTGRKTRGTTMFILDVWVVAALILTNLSEIFLAFLVIPLLILILMWLNDMIKLLAGSFLDADDRPVNKWH
jgi:TM2 domain-containing membrane protein YozV